MKRTCRACFTVLWLMLLATPAMAEDACVWWEGEKPAKTNFPDSTWFDPQNAGERDKLSGGDWLTHIDKRPAGSAIAFARYRIEVPRKATYQLWARKMWKHGPFRWRFDSNQWRTCGRDIALADSVTLRTHVPANWVHLGEVELAAGERRFEIELLAGEGEAQTAAFDCFVLIDGPFVPNGKLKPGEKLNRADPGYFAWEPGVDPFDHSPIDLRDLNEARAGMNGRVARRGERLVLGDGTPVRFWAVNVSQGNAAQSRDSIDYLARKLAKLGVNMVRYHSALFDAANVEQIDKRKLDHLHYLIDAMARQGIYTKVSFYFPLWFDASKYGELGGFEEIGNNKPFGLLFFEPRMQEIHRAWLSQLLTTPNPYTGRKLAEDPAVAMIEIVNEDSLFFWTFSKKNIPPRHWKRLEGMFARYVGDRDAKLHGAWHMTRDGLKHAAPEQRKSIGQQVRFITGLQRDYYADTIKHMRRLGYAGVVSASNWKTADAQTLGALERYTYTAGDVIDRHGYFGGKHEGDGSSYSVRVGHRYEDRAGVREPWALPITVQQVAGYPHIISELGWPNPNRYRGEATTLTAAYAALQGIDGVFWFAVGSNFLADRGMNKFAVASPAGAGTFPANALIYRRAYVAESDAVVREGLKLGDLYSMKGSVAISAAALDPLRERDLPRGQRAVRRLDALDPLSFFAGKVVRSIDPRGGRSHLAVELPELIDREGHTVRSITGQLALNYKQGLATLDTDRAKGAVGFFTGRRSVSLGNFAINCGNEFASVLLVSLDDQPLDRSKQILVQAFTEERPYGFKTDDGTIRDLGGPPFGVREIKVGIELASSISRDISIQALDANGYPVGEPSRGDLLASTDVRFTLNPKAMYHLIRRK